MLCVHGYIVAVEPSKDISNPVCTRIVYVPHVHHICHQADIWSFGVTCIEIALARRGSVGCMGP